MPAKAFISEAEEIKVIYVTPDAPASQEKINGLLLDGWNIVGKPALVWRAESQQHLLAFTVIRKKKLKEVGGMYRYE